MTEEQWLSSARPDAMLAFMEGKVSNRKLRLFSIGCCRRLCGLGLIGPYQEGVLQIAERIADSLPVDVDLDLLRSQLWHLGFEAIDGFCKDRDSKLTYHTYHSILATIQTTGEGELAYNTRSSEIKSFLSASTKAAWAVAEWFREDDDIDPNVEIFLHELEDHARLAHCIFGNPFSRAAVLPPALDPALRQMAWAIYRDRNWTLLPFLADLAIESGIDLPNFLKHAKVDTVHARGCWVVDRVLGEARSR